MHEKLLNLVVGVLATYTFGCTKAPSTSQFPQVHYYGYFGWSRTTSRPQHASQVQSPSGHVLILCRNPGVQAGANSEVQFRVG